MRISTSEIFKSGIGAIQGQQTELARTQQQLATGRRMLAPSDDPGGAVQALKLRERLGELDQYGRNASLATARLGQSETALGQMSQILDRARELTVQAANATQTDESRAAIAREIRQLADGLVDIGNARDGAGEYLFAGFRTAAQPFVRGADGRVQYLGDAGARRVALSADRTVAVGDSGAAFMSVPRGNGLFVATAAPTNTGSGRVAVAEVVDPQAVDRAVYEIRFVSDDAWEVRDAAGDLVVSGSYAAGQTVDIGGRRIGITGAPAAGDVFRVEPAGQSSVFDTLDALATRLATPAPGAAAGARFAEDVDRALADIDQALNRVLEVRSDVGARVNAIESQGEQNVDQALRVRTALSGIEDLDYAEAVSRFQMQQVALQAAQQAYVQLSRLSLFDFIR